MLQDGWQHLRARSRAFDPSIAAVPSRAMILGDTSVWLSHLRQRSKILSDLTEFALRIPG
jgi:hypothetical protein